MGLLPIGDIRGEAGEAEAEAVPMDMLPHHVPGSKAMLGPSP
jgi:hypothetical protein